MEIGPVPRQTDGSGRLGGVRRVDGKDDRTEAAEGSRSALPITVVIPVKDRASLLSQCLDSLVISARDRCDVRVIVCDNGSTDSTLDVARSYLPFTTVVMSSSATVAGVRNDGASADPDAAVYAFLDCDCLVPEHFFSAIVDTMEATGAAAVGCEVRSRPDGHWTERVWDGLHRPGGDGPRHYINSACFCIRSDWFGRLGGFDCEKVSSEDVDICRRLAALGGTMWQSEQLAVLHLGNPQSVAGLYRRIRWHGEGIWERGKGIQWSATTLFTLLHPVVLILATIAGLRLLQQGNLWGLAAVAFGAGAIPTLFVIARAVQHRRRVPFLGGIVLMSITFPARLHGLIRSRRARTPQGA